MIPEMPSNGMEMDNEVLASTRMAEAGLHLGAAGRRQHDWF